MSKTPMQLAFEYCDKTPISWFDRIFVSLKEIRIGAFKSGYQAGYNEAKKYWANQPKYDADQEWIEKANKYVFNRSAWADMIEKHEQEKKDR
jgi:hypothetical protein